MRGPPGLTPPPGPENSSSLIESAYGGRGWFGSSPRVIADGGLVCYFYYDLLFVLPLRIYSINEDAVYVR